MKTWVPLTEPSDFNLYNLPYGIYSHKDSVKKAGVALGDCVIDLNWLHTQGHLSSIELPNKVFQSSYLNDFIALGKPVWTALRGKLQDLFEADNDTLKAHSDQVLVPLDEIQMHMPVFIRDYTDFYSSIEHATNVGTMFRGPENALMPNWKHIPIGYHGRASSVILSGMPVHRPSGQVKDPDATGPDFRPSQRIDFELEMGFIIGKANALGNPVAVDEAEDHIFGKVLVNDWSARDVQKWEYVPLGPFLSKSFATSISPWIVTMEALEPFRVQGPRQDPEVLPYLQYFGKRNYDIQLEVYIQPKNGEAVKVSSSNFKYMYWNMCQQLAHHTVNGCNLNIGDLLASGTISGKDPDSYGSMLELTWAGKNPIALSPSETRTFIHDGDTVIMKGYCEKDGIRIGFGEVRCKLLPAK